MKKVFFIAGFVILCRVEVFSLTDFYYAYGEKIPITISPNGLVIKFKNKENSRLFSSTENIVKHVEQIKFTPAKDFYQVNFYEKQNVEELLKQYKERVDINNVNYIYLFDGIEAIPYDQFSVQFKSSISYEQIVSLNEKHNVEFIPRTVKIPDLYRFRITDSSDCSVIDMSKVYYESLNAEWSVPDFIVPIQLFSPNDTYFINQYYLHNTGQTGGINDADIDALEAWNISTGSSSITVAVIDEGCSSHEDLPLNKISDGYDFVNFDSDASPEGNQAHGMACAGVIAATQNNNLGISGISPNSKIMPIRIFDAWGDGISYSYCAEAIDFAWLNEADIISNSWGYSSSNPDLYPEIVGAINRALTEGRNGKGSIVVFGTGNWARRDNEEYAYVGFPACIPGVIAVGAIDKSNNIQNYSPRDDEISVVAPSGDLHYPYGYELCNDPELKSNTDHCHKVKETRGDVWSIDIEGNQGWNDSQDGLCYPTYYIEYYGEAPNGDNCLPGNYTSHFGGTSAACPQVSGIAALILSVNPDLTQAQVANIIKQTADDMGASGWDNDYGYGRANAYKALKYTLENYGGTLTQNLSIPSGETWTFHPGVTLSFGNGCSLIVSGTLIAQGTSSNHITFTSNDATPSAGDWDGIRFEDSSIDASCILKYCTIEYADYGIYCNYANPKIENNTITHNSYGIYLYYSSPTYVNTNNISYNSSGVYGISASPTLTDNLLNMNGSYGAYFFGGSPSFTSNSFKRNEYGAYFSNSSFPKFGPTSGTGQGNNVIYSNDTWGIRAQFYSDPFMGSSDAYNNRIGGYNTIYSNGQANAYAYYYSDIEAQWNWWGYNPPPTNMFFYSIAGTIDYSNYLGTDPGGGSSLGKIATSNMAIDNTHNKYEEAGFNPKKPNPNKLSDLWLWGHDLYINNKVKDAVQIYKILVNKFSSSDQAKKALGKIYYWSQKIGKTDISSYLSSIIENSEIDTDLKPIAYELLADSHQKNGKIINAINAYETVINEYPKADNQKFVLFKLVLCEKNDLKNTESANNYLSMLRQNYPDDEVTFFACEEMGEEVDWALAKRNYEPQTEKKIILPEKYALRGNYPNPFNPSTTIAFDLPEDAKVSVIIYDITGREIIKVVDERLPAGFRNVIWDGKDKTGQTVASGLYIYSMRTASGFQASRKMVFVR